MQPTKDKGSFLFHVNGMRAVAILGILIYHLNPAYCPSGYFGVDIFLVISGYFLLASLMKAQSPGDIHYGTYLLKKSWRIIPSWFVLTCVFYFACALFMIPEDRLEICNTASRSAFFGADFYIDSRYDYFNQRAHQNLFLHYWYLSIICQMYIVLPLLVMLLMRFFSRKGMAVVLGMTGLLSLSLYVLTTTMQVPEDIRNALLAGTGMKTTYYHLLPRLWEILAGGAVLLLPEWQDKRRLRIVLETLGAFGMVFSFFYYPMGSPQVYMAAVSAVLFIRYGGEGCVSRLLAWRPFQWVGTISFSLYLWHWPIMAAWKYVSLGDITWYDELGMLLLSFLLATLAWKWVEGLKMPKSSSPLMVSLRFLPILMILFFAVATRPYYKGIRGQVQQGLRGKGVLTEMLADLESQPRDKRLLKGLDRTVHPSHPLGIGDASAEPSFLLMGDSHSLHSFHGLHMKCAQRGLRGIYYNNSVIPFWGCYWSFKDGSTTWNKSKAEAMEEYLRQNPNIKYVFVALWWQARMYGSPADLGGETMDWDKMQVISHEEQNALREAGLREQCRRITAMGKRVILLQDVPTFPMTFSPYQMWLKVKKLRGEDAPEHTTPAEKFRKENYYIRFFERLVEEGVVWATIDCAEPFRQGDYYRTRTDEGEFLYSDPNHITYIASEMVGEYVISEWERLKRERELAPETTVAN